MSKFPECDLCPTSNCDDEKIEMVLQDADFTKAFVNNMLASNIDEISKDCYFMSEVISEKTSPIEIADFAFCIYVQLSQLVEMPMDKRMEIGVMFRQEFDRMGEDVSQGREIAKKKIASPTVSKGKDATPDRKEVSFQAKAIANPAQVMPKVAASQQAKPSPPSVKPAPPSVKPAPPSVKPAPPPSPAPSNEDARKFLAELDQDIADIDAIASNVEKIIQSEGEPAPVVAVTTAASPARKIGGLEPVINKLAGARPVPVSKAPVAQVPRELVTPRQPEKGSKANPIKLTPEMLAGIVSEKDMARVEKGIKIKRVDASRLAPKVASPLQMRNGSMAAMKPTGMPEKIERIERSADKSKVLGEELFSAFQQIKAREELPSTFNLETLGVGEHGGEAIEATEKKASAGSQFITDLFSLSPEKSSESARPVNPPKPTSRPAIDNLTLDFGEEATLTGSAKICPKCKKPNPAKNAFCAKCGAKF